MAPATAPPPTGYGGCASITTDSDDYRTLFRTPMAGAAGGKYETSGGGGGRGRDEERNPPRFRAAVEAERWRAKLSGDTGGKASTGRDELHYNQRQQADWARERLLGSAPPSVEEMEEEEEESRTQKVVGQAWVPSSSVWVDTTAIDRLEETMRRRLGELESTASHAGRAARAFFSECDPTRQGRVTRRAFVECMARKMQYDFPARGASPSSTAVLEALFDRYDTQRAGVVAADDLHAALAGAAREGRASGRVVRTIGRLREGLVRYGGGFDALRELDGQWFMLQAQSRHPRGCLPCSMLVDGLMRLAAHSRVVLTDADIATMLETFEPPPTGAPPTAAYEPLVAFTELTVALRGPPMSRDRVAMVRAAYAALKDDAKAGKAVKPFHLAARYDASVHPAVLAKAVRMSDAALAFLGFWKGASAEALDSEVSLAEMCDRYEWISPLYHEDARFEAMIKAAWRLHLRSK